RFATCGASSAVATRPIANRSMLAWRGRAPPRSDDAATAVQPVHEHAGDAEDEQDVDGEAGDVERQEAEQPQHQQDDADDQKHEWDPPVTSRLLPAVRGVIARTRVHCKEQARSGARAPAKGTGSG